MIYKFLQNWRDQFKAPSSFTYALPLDCFRIGVGFLSFLYFIRIMHEAPYFLAHDGLINHQLVLDIFWFTWQPLFHHSMTLPIIQIILMTGIGLSLILMAGVKTRPVAFVLYLMVVCIYRYQFLVLFVDDVIIHLLLFWCFVLPTGKTLTLLEWLKDKKVMGRWLKIKVEDYTLRLFLYNIGLIYFVAGISKFSSELWLEGIALFATLKLPLGWFSDYPLESLATLIKAGNYIALFTEPLFVFLVILKPWNKFKMFLGVCLGIFHLVIIMTLDVPFANLGCLILIPIIFRHELIDLILKNEKDDQKEIVFNQSIISRLIASSMVVLLTGAMFCALTQNQWRKSKRVYGKEASAEVKGSSADSGGKIQTAFYGGLWIMGLAQGYRLLDWIDERNFHQTVLIKETNGNIKKEYPRSSLVPVGMRGSLILTYVSEVTWMYVHPEKISDLRLDIKNRLQKMYCKKIVKRTQVEVWHAITRIDSFDPKYNKPEILLKFECENLKTLARVE